MCVTGTQLPTSSQDLIHEVGAGIGNRAATWSNKAMGFHTFNHSAKWPSQGGERGSQADNQQRNRDLSHTAIRKWILPMEWCTSLGSPELSGLLTPTFCLCENLRKNYSDSPKLWDNAGNCLKNTPFGYHSNRKPVHWKTMLLYALLPSLFSGSHCNSRI